MKGLFPNGAYNSTSSKIPAGEGEPAKSPPVVQRWTPAA